MLAIQSPIIKNDPCLLRVSNVASTLSFYCSACKKFIDEKYLLENVMSCPDCNNEGLTCVLEYKDVRLGKVLFTEYIDLNDDANGMPLI